MPMRLRSMVGIIPLFAVATLDDTLMARFPAFEKRARWFLANRPEYAEHLAVGLDERGTSPAKAAVLGRTRPLEAGAREAARREGVPLPVRRALALGEKHREEPYEADIAGKNHRVEYDPGESSSGLFGGNSNRRGTMRFPVNYLLIESLQKFHYYYGDDFIVECPTGSGVKMNLWEVASELSRRLVSLYLVDGKGVRPAHGGIGRARAARSALPRLDHLLRILSRRQRTGARRLAPDGLDSARRQAPRSEATLAGSARARASIHLADPLTRD